MLTRNKLKRLPTYPEISAKSPEMVAQTENTVAKTPESKIHHLIIANNVNHGLDFT